MKSLQIFNRLIILVAVLFLTGCYTQVATRHSDYETQDYETQDYESNDDGDEYYQTPSDSESYNYDDEGEFYNDDDGVIINQYYSDPFFPSYRRYFRNYYPSIGIGVSFGSYYYDSFCWDPFYYSAWCAPLYDPYYYGFYYYPGYYSYPYYGGYNGGYWYDSHTTYRERNNDITRIRNNDGLRSSYTSRGNLTRGNNTSILKNNTRNRNEVNLDKVRTNTRTTIENRNIEKKRTNVKNDTENKTNIRNKNVPPEYKAPTKEIRKNNNVNRNKTPNVKKESTRNKTNETRTQKKYNVKQNNDQPKSYTPPKKTYDAPKRTYNPPKNYNPPQRNSTPPSNRSGNRGSNNTGKTRR